MIEMQTEEPPEDPNIALEHFAGNPSPGVPLSRDQ